MPVDDKVKMISKIRATIVDDEKTEVNDSTPQGSSADNLKKYFQHRYPQDSEAKIMARVLQTMKNQFMKTFSASDNESIGSHGSMELDTSNKFYCLAGESQAEEEPTISDYWDSMIAIMEDHTKSSKGKEVVEE